MQSHPIVPAPVRQADADAHLVAKLRSARHRRKLTGETLDQLAIAREKAESAHRAALADEATALDLIHAVTDPDSRSVVTFTARPQK